ncbi:MAG TPA: PP2C family protein-serine/threonine phosphatase [Terriglobales bacterium]|nr:PP2C family protein-serine/threonine phosphatase [Terriglobales bacterium]
MATEELVVDVSQDWVLACDVQQRFMQAPGGTSDFVDYSARCRQVRALGGDCFDFLPLPDRRLAFLVGDASGKGLAAALMIANVQSSLRTAALFTGDVLAALLSIVNRQAYHSSLANHYATLFYGVFDGTTRSLRYVNAGHNPAIVVRSNGSFEWLETGGAPVGMFADSEYRESVVQLQGGDLVIAYTDGVVEAANPQGEQWGVSGLLEAIAESQRSHVRDAEDIVPIIWNSMDEFSNGVQADDATLAITRVM